MLAGGSRDRVLVIDDDPDLRELVALLLPDWGLVAVEAEDCASALALIDRERGRLRAVLLDYFMPGLDPRKCTREILSRVEPGVAVVLMSAAVDIGARAAEVGLARWLAKPFELTDLRAAVLASG
jgi:CheY-like chemotaxis protein